MTEQPAAYPGYATPTFVQDGAFWRVTAHPWGIPVGTVWDSGPVGWSAHTPRKAFGGLYPDKQAAGEALVKHAGYEVLR